ncbi:MAG: hypothetical protein ACLT38_12975 [Akkermansia sp.]
MKTKTAKTAKKAADEKAPVSETVVAPSEAPAPSAPVEKEMMPEAPQKPQAAAPVKVKRESFRPNRNAEQQERHEQHGGDVFAQPETVGGASEGPFNKRKRRRRNKKGGGSEDRQPMQDAASLKQLDCKKVASRAWKMFLAEVSEEGLALMDDQTAREAAAALSAVRILHDGGSAPQACPESSSPAAGENFFSGRGTGFRRGFRRRIIPVCVDVFALRRMPQAFCILRAYFPEFEWPCFIRCIGKQHAPPFATWGQKAAFSPTRALFENGRALEPLG